MLEQSGHRDRRNIRPIILSVCFVCGVILGFISYLASPSFAAKQEVQDAKDKAEDARKEAQLKSQVKPVQAAPDFVSVDKEVAPVPELNIPVKNKGDFDSERDPAKGELRAAPEAQAVAMNYDTGLTGRTTYRPLPPVRVEKPAPAVDFNKRPAAAPGGKAVDINNVALPEFED